MKKTVLLLFICLLNLSSFAQDSETLDNGITAIRQRDLKEVLIKENKKVKIWQDDGSEIKSWKGRLKIINDSTIAIDDVQINISDISKIRTPRLAARIIGGILTIGGGTILIAGVALIGNSVITDQALGIILGGIVATFGAIPTFVGIPILFIGKKYDRKDWSFSVQN